MKLTKVLLDIVSVPLFFILFVFTFIVAVPVLYIVETIEGNKENKLVGQQSKRLAHNNHPGRILKE